MIEHIEAFQESIKAQLEEQYKSLKAILPEEDFNVMMKAFKDLQERGLKEKLNMKGEVDRVSEIYKNLDSTKEYFKQNNK